MKYTDREAVENLLLQTIDASFYPQIEQWIEAMSRQADREANRTLCNNIEETYSYDGDNSNLLVINDCNSITSIIVDGKEVLEKVRQYPQNKDYTSRIFFDGRFPKGKGNVKVTGIHAMFKEVPADIKYACTVLVAGICRNQIFNEREGKTERIGNYSVTYKEGNEAAQIQTAKQTLLSYRRIAIG